MEFLVVPSDEVNPWTDEAGGVVRFLRSVRERLWPHMEPIADAMGATLAQFSLAWCLQNPHVSTVMTGASCVEQVHENMKALRFVDQFTADVMAEIDRIFA